ncbi:MarR family transcriptional regulator [Brevibacillus fluminis]|uniref:MarR family transcriptional regulator n=1 Tax=Brevibacillus fluminis TaxID=511487 RepID=A0A3M8DB51_9BACL|nr:MarR family transcriptional regulator [Brevibacillus fluminis]RNB84497.1 MarR family transcriptional regulator [Brevibacillus fluminis]
MSESIQRLHAINRLSRATYSLTSADGRLRGRATRIPGAISLAHARALKVLAVEGELSIKDLATHTETTASGVTQLVNGLETNGYVERIRSSQDRRTVTVKLTPKGMARHQERDLILNRLLQESLTDFTTEQIEQASDIITRLCTVFDEL